MGTKLTLAWVTALILLAVVAGSACGSVVINELMADPASDWSPTDGDLVYHSLDDEWLEIYNTGPDAVDISGWRLRDAISDSSWKYEFSGTLEPGEMVVVYGNESYDWEDAHGYLKNGLSLNNGGDTITLVRDDGTVADIVEYTGSEVRDDCSWGRMPDGSGDWWLFDQLNPMSPPATDLPPTPGDTNTGSPVEAMAWSRIKALYRDAVGGGAPDSGL